MATIGGSYNVLLGANSVLPDNNDSRQFVVGGPLSTSYLAYASVSGVAAGVRVQSSRFEIMGGTSLSVGSTGGGNAGEALYSGGPGAPPAWGAAPVAGTAVRFSNSASPALANVYTATAASLTLTMPAPASGATTIVKNRSVGTLTVAATIGPVSTTDVVSSITIGSGGAAGLMADSTTWYQQW